MVFSSGRKSSRVHSDEFRDDKDILSATSDRVSAKEKQLMFTGHASVSYGCVTKHPQNCSFLTSLQIGQGDLLV